MDFFKELINELTPLLKKMGFNKKGNNFYLDAGNNWGVVNIQKSRENSKHLIKFTINFGIYSDVLGRFQFDYNDSVKPEVEQCQWRARIGAFMPDSPDFWWNINRPEDLSNITTSVIESVRNIIVPQLNKLISDEGLLQSWMNENYAGTTDLSRFEYLTILLQTKGDFDALYQVVEKFIQQSKGKPNASKAIEHLKRLKYDIKITEKKSRKTL